MGEKTPQRPHIPRNSGSYETWMLPGTICTGGSAPPTRLAPTASTQWIWPNTQFSTILTGNQCG